jgi:hypothetical protein
MVEFGSSTKCVAPNGRCDKAHYHGMLSGYFSIFQPSPPNGIPHMLQTFDVKKIGIHCLAYWDKCLFYHTKIVSKSEQQHDHLL